MVCVRNSAERGQGAQRMGSGRDLNPLFKLVLKVGGPILSGLFLSILVLCLGLLNAAATCVGRLVATGEPLAWFKATRPHFFPLFQVVETMVQETNQRKKNIGQRLTIDEQRKDLRTFAASVLTEAMMTHDDTAKMMREHRRRSGQMMEEVILPMGKTLGLLLVEFCVLFLLFFSVSLVVLSISLFSSAAVLFSEVTTGPQSIVERRKVWKTAKTFLEMASSPGIDQYICIVDKFLSFPNRQCQTAGGDRRRPGPGIPLCC